MTGFGPFRSEANGNAPPLSLGNRPFDRNGAPGLAFYVGVAMIARALMPLSKPRAIMPLSKPKPDIAAGKEAEQV